MKIAVIPARGGSKRIPGKNIKPFFGKPMIAWSIEAAKKSNVFDHILVSTDDTQIAEVARSFGAEVPFLRPADISDDFTPTVPVVAHAVRWASENLGSLEAVCCIYATAPFITPSAILEGLDVLENTGAPYAFSVTSFPFPIQRGLRYRADGTIEMLHPEHVLTRSQDLEETYHDAGQFYWGTPEAWSNGLSLMGNGNAAVILARHQVQDIDTLEDWDRAEQLFNLMITTHDDKTGA